MTERPVSVAIRALIPLGSADWFDLLEQTVRQLRDTGSLIGTVAGNGEAITIIFVLYEARDHQAIVERRMLAKLLSELGSEPDTVSLISCDLARPSVKPRHVRELLVSQGAGVRGRLLSERTPRRSRFEEVVRLQLEREVQRSDLVLETNFSRSSEIALSTYNQSLPPRGYAEL